MKFGAVVAFTLLIPMVIAQAPLEIDILEEYLAEHDLLPGIPHCTRHDGTFGVPGEHGTSTPLGGTNEILVEHKDWHENNGFGMEVSPDESDQTGTLFIDFHHDFLATYNEWRLESDYPSVVAWNPADPMPPELAYSFPERACEPQETEVRTPLPSWFTLEGGPEADGLYGYTELCQFQDKNQLGKTIRSSYHITVHQTYGQATMQDPRDPWFWSFHQFMDGQVALFEEQCMEASPTGETHNAPAPFALLLAMLFLGRWR